MGGGGVRDGMEWMGQWGSVEMKCFGRGDCCGSWERDWAEGGASLQGMLTRQASVIISYYQQNFIGFSRYIMDNRIIIIIVYTLLDCIWFTYVYFIGI